MRRLFWIGMSALLALAIVSGGLYARAAETFPELIDLPNAWLPEGVVTGRGPVIYSGSRANGAIYAADLRTGAGSIIVQGTPGRVAVGLSFDQRSNYIFVAGGATGSGYVYDADTGATVATYQFTTSATTFVNDVIVTRDAAYFTDSRQAVLYRVPIGPGGRVSNSFETIPLSGDFQLVAGNNANGIEATPNGDTLIVVNSALGVLYNVDPETGVATLIDLGGASVSNGDGILLQGNTLYVVRNRLNQIAVIELAPDLLSGAVVDVITNSNFDVPTTVAAFGRRLYAVNARFGTPNTPETTYTIVQVSR
jgi:sugar lactone lactonase YvrE